VGPSGNPVQHVALVLPRAWHPIARGFAHELHRRGIRVTYVCTGTEADRRADRAAYDVRMLPPVHSGARGTLRFAREAANLVRELRPDVCHVFAFRGAGLLPVVARGPRYLYYVVTANVGGGRLAALADRITAAEAARYHGRAVNARGVGLRVGGEAWADVPILPIGFRGDLAAKAREARRARGASEPVRLGYVGTLSPQRRLDALVEAAGRLKESGHAFTWELLGDGADRPRLEALIRGRGLASAMRFVGAALPDEVWDFHAGTDVSVAWVPVAPEFEYQPALKTVEAMGCGLAVVATDTAGNRELVTDGEDGLLVADDAEALAEALEHLIRSPDVRRKLGDAAVEAVADRTFERIVGDVLLPLYARIG
jgi:glycosyltransferase involved in cell wall biosynthesis